MVNRSPKWANGGRPGIWAPRPGYFRDFLTAASRRYPSVRRWMIWGEPNRTDRFQPNAMHSRRSPRAYARFLDAAYAGLKRASRRNVVIGGMTWTGGETRPALFLRWLRLPSGRRPRLDWYGHNPFPFRKPRLRANLLSGGWRDISDMDVFAKEIARAFPGRPRLWLSEFTVVSDKRSNIFQIFKSQEEQASWLAAAFRVANRVPAVAGLGWLSLLDQPPAPGSANWGLFADGRRFEAVPEPAPSEGPLRLLYAGTVGLAQGVDTLAEAAAIAGPDVVQVTIAGDGAELDHVRRYAARRSPANADVLGAVPAERIPEQYAEADAAVVLLRDRPAFSSALPTKMGDCLRLGASVTTDR